MKASPAVNRTRLVIGTALLLLLAILVLTLLFAVTSVGAGPAPVPIAGETVTYALWANSQSESQAIYWPGNDIVVCGAVHTNRDAVISGANSGASGPFEYVTTYTDSGSNNYFNPTQTGVDPPPVTFDLAAFQPGGALATQAENEGRYHSIGGNFNVNANDVLLDGLYYVTGKIKVSGNNAHGTATFVSEDTIRIAGAGADFTPYLVDLLFFSAKSQAGQEIIRLEGPNATLEGAQYVPGGVLAASASDISMSGPLIAGAITLSGSDLLIDAGEPCPEIPTPTPPPPPPTGTPPPTHTPPPGATPTPTSTPFPPPPGGFATQHLPLITYNGYVGPGEPNNNCFEAYALSPNVTYTFLPEDRHDWYQFDLGAPAHLSVRLTDFVPLAGQIAVYAGPTCNDAVLLGNNGYPGPEKSLDLGNRPAGHYFLYVSNDGPLNGSDRYTLLVEALP